LKVVGHIPSKCLIEDRERIKRTVSWGIGVELQISSRVMDMLSLEEFCLIAEMVKGKVVTFHAPFLDLNPGALDSYVLDATRRRFLEMKPLVRIFSPEVIVFHTGFHPDKTAHAYEDWLLRSVETFKIVSFELETKIALENVFDTDTTPLSDLIERLPSNVGVCIDVGHLNLFSTVPVGTWIETFKERIFEFHVHDNNGMKDEHLSIGKGSIDFESFFSIIDSLNSEYILTLEAKREKEQLDSLNYIKKRRLKIEQSAGNKSLSR